MPRQNISPRPTTSSSLTLDRLLAALAAGTAGELLADALYLPRPAAVTVMIPTPRVVASDEVTR